jgi:hypothetical protein
MSDDFLTKLYEDEKEKVASAELADFMRGMGRDDLEAFLGLDKQAVAGPAEPELPTSASASEIEAAHQAKKTYVEQEHSGNPKGVTKQPERAQTSDSQSRDSKVKTTKEDEPKTKSAGAKVIWADKIGRMFAKEAAEKASCGGMVKNEDFTDPAAKAKAKAFAATMKASKGKPLEARKNALQRTEAAIEKKAINMGALKSGLSYYGRGAGLGGAVGAPIGALIGAARAEKGERLKGALRGGAVGAGAGALGNVAGLAAMRHLGNKGMKDVGKALTEEGATVLDPRIRGASNAALLGSAGMGTAGMVGGGLAGGAAVKRALGKSKGGKEKESQGMGDVGMAGADMGDMETTAAVKAKIAARAMKISEGAPEHVKAAAVFMAGREIAKMASKGGTTLRPFGKPQPR